MCFFIYRFKVIDPFPRPNKNVNSIQYRNKLTQNSNNCDMNYVEKPISPILAEKLNEIIDPIPSTHTPMYNETMKENVIRELLETEENYIKLLSSLCIGYAILLILFIYTIFLVFFSFSITNYDQHKVF